MADAISKDESQMTPAEWLDSVRQKYGLVGNLDVPDNWLADLLSRIPETDREAARKVWLARRSQSASQVHDELVQTYLQEVLPVLRPNERTVAETTFFGIFPTYQFNAFAGFTPGGDRIVILHHALVYTLSYWSHWYLRTKDEGGRDHLRETPEKLFEALAHIVSVWLGQRPHGGLPDIYPKTADSWQLDQCLVFSAISFIIGHEMGHILGGHNGYGPDSAQNHAMEFEADRSGLSIAIRHSLVKTIAIEGDTYHAKFMLFGPLFALAVMSLLSDRSSHSHPSASDRRTALVAAYESELRNVLGARLDDFLEDVDRDVLDVLERNSRNLFMLFANYRELILELRSAMQVPHAPWLREEFARFRS